jgi:hypothetical protein
MNIFVFKIVIGSTEYFVGGIEGDVWVLIKAKKDFFISPLPRLNEIEKSQTSFFVTEEEKNHFIQCYNARKYVEYIIPIELELPEILKKLNL